MLDSPLDAYVERKFTVGEIVEAKTQDRTSTTWVRFEVLCCTLHVVTCRNTVNGSTILFGRKDGKQWGLNPQWQLTGVKPRV